jgi:hypothetical protein
MKTETFDKLIANLKRNTSDTDLSLGMKAKWQTYELNVYCEDAGQMTVECTEQDNEVQLGGSQLQRIENIFIAELDQIEINAKYENTDGFTDDYESTGTKQSDFY